MTMMMNIRRLTRSFFSFFTAIDYKLGQDFMILLIWRKIKKGIEYYVVYMKKENLEFLF